MRKGEPKENLEKNPYFNKYRKGIETFKDKPIEIQEKLIEKERKGTSFNIFYLLNRTCSRYLQQQKQFEK